MSTRAIEAFCHGCKTIFPASLPGKDTPCPDCGAPASVVAVCQLCDSKVGISSKEIGTASECPICNEATFWNVILDTDREPAAVCTTEVQDLAAALAGARRSMAERRERAAAMAGAAAAERQAKQSAEWSSQWQCYTCGNMCDFHGFGSMEQCGKCGTLHRRRFFDGGHIVTQVEVEPVELGYVAIGVSALKRLPYVSSSAEAKMSKAPAIADLAYKAIESIRNCDSCLPSLSLSVQRSILSQYHIVGVGASKRLYGHRIGTMHISFVKDDETQSRGDLYGALRGSARDILWCA